MNVVSNDEAIAMLLQGGVGVIPTDTVYGIVARTADPAAVRKLYGLKQRDRKPAPVIAASISQLQSLGIRSSDIARVQHLWPNPVSIILQAAESSAYIHFGMGLAVRIPADKRLRALLEQTGPLLASSANLPSEAVSTTTQEAYDYFGEQLDFYVDGGDITGRAASTNLKLTEDGLEVVRQGTLSLDDDMLVLK